MIKKIAVVFVVGFICIGVSAHTLQLRKPSSKQMATAAVMKANGILSQKMYETYMVTGQYSMIAINAETARNNSLAAIEREERLSREAVYNEQAMADLISENEKLTDKIEELSNQIIKLKK